MINYINLSSKSNFFFLITYSIFPPVSKRVKKYREKKKSILFRPVIRTSNRTIILCMYKKNVKKLSVKISTIGKKSKNYFQTKHFIAVLFLLYLYFASSYYPSGFSANFVLLFKKKIIFVVVM